MNQRLNSCHIKKNLISFHHRYFMMLNTKICFYDDNTIQRKSFSIPSVRFPLNLTVKKAFHQKCLSFVIWKTDRQRSHRHCRTMYLPVSFALTLRLKTLFSGRPDVIVRTMPSLSIWNLSRKKIERSQRGAESRREKVDYPTNRKSEIKMGSKFQQSPQEK